MLNFKSWKRPVALHNVLRFRARVQVLSFLIKVRVPVKDLQIADNLVEGPEEMLVELSAVKIESLTLESTYAGRMEGIK